jgi:hypothetical protein
MRNVKLKFRDNLTKEQISLLMGLGFRYFSRNISQGWIIYERKLDSDNDPLDKLEKMALDLKCENFVKMFNKATTSAAHIATCTRNMAGSLRPEARDYVNDWVKANVEKATTTTDIVPWSD